MVIDRDQPGAIKALISERFDAVVDVATGGLGWVLDALDALDALAERARHWTFVSSINVYADTATLSQSTDAALCEPVWDTKHYDLSTELTVERYGGIKVATWIVTAAEHGLSGTYDAIGHVLELGPVLRETAALVGAPAASTDPVRPA